MPLSITDCTPLTELTALSPLDGRYRAKVLPLAACFSEAALAAARLEIEVAYLIALAEAVGAPVGAEQAKVLQVLVDTFSPAEAAELKAIEARIRHDVKAVEYYLKDRLPSGLPAFSELVHLGLTSEDVNNLAYARLVTRALADVLLPAMRRLVEALLAQCEASRELPMLARTHGQPASPTTLGKELGVFLYRLVGELEGLSALRLAGKLNGATGTFGALAIAYPEVDWLAFSRRFVEGLGLVHNPVTTQIESRDRLCALFDQLRRVHHVLLDLAQDAWWYVGHGTFVQRVDRAEVGSSTMPHKVNPIDFENAEGNLGLANALLVHLGEKVTRSRLQRDLSDSTVMRNIGVALGHGLLAYDALARGLERIAPDEGVLRAELAGHPEVLAEAIQTAMRARGCAAPYELLKDLTRGRPVAIGELRELVAASALTGDCRETLLALTPETYTGLADRLADVAIAAARGYLTMDGERSPRGEHLSRGSGVPPGTPEESGHAGDSQHGRDRRRE